MSPPTDADLVRPPATNAWPSLAVAAKLAATVMLFLSYAPLVWLAAMSLSADPLSGIPGKPTLASYAMLMSDQRWLGPLWTSIQFGCFVGLACALVGTVTARLIPFARRRGALIVMFLLPLVVPGVLLGFGLFIYYRVILHLVMGPWSIITGHFVWAFPFALLVLLINTSRFDVRLREAACALGASPWRTFVDIELPLILPGIVGAALFGFLLSFNELSRSILLRGGTTTLPLYEWAQASAHTSNVPLVFSLSTIIFIVSLLFISVSFWFLFGRAQTGQES
jgi:ABC-type spermidine/putrescine transport system permease subunit II